MVGRGIYYLPGPDHFDKEKKLNIDLLDQDQRALLHTQKNIRQISKKVKHNFNFNYINKAIKNIIAVGLDKDKKYDLIYSAGLFDYFTDPVAQIAATQLYKALKPGGKLVIGNFSITSPNIAVMDLALDWKLIYRSENNLTKLYDHIGDEFLIENEHLNINLFCVISKN